MVAPLLALVAVEVAFTTVAGRIEEVRMFFPLAAPLAVLGVIGWRSALEARPGAYIFLGNGPSAPLHSDTYDFNDETIPAGISYWSRLVETILSPE